jgi:hypothetical protein
MSKNEGKRPFGRQRSRLENNKMDFTYLPFILLYLLFLLLKLPSSAIIFCCLSSVSISSLFLLSSFSSHFSFSVSFFTSSPFSSRSNIPSHYSPPSLNLFLPSLPPASHSSSFSFSSYFFTSSFFFSFSYIPSYFFIPFPHVPSSSLFSYIIQIPTGSRSYFLLVKLRLNSNECNNVFNNKIKPLYV